MQTPLVGIFAALMFWFFGPDVTIKRADDKYDFIVVGAGTAGSVVASKLSDDFTAKVLLLEAGNSDLTVPKIFIPGYWTSLGHSTANWNYTTAPQQYTFFSNPDRTLPYTQGKVLGGSSSLNAMAYIRGSPHDYDSWEDHGAEGWNYKTVEPNFRKVENARGNHMPESMGKNGKLKLSSTLQPQSEMTKLIEGIAASFGLRVGNSNDHFEGFSYAIRSVYGLMRQNSATAYLRSVLPDSGRQLHILTGAHVTKLLIDDENNTYGVQYVKDGQSLTAYADKEVILSAGVFGTPKLLMLSGVGPRAELEKFNISVLADLPGIGSNLNDHTYVFNTFTTNIKLPEPKIHDPEVQYLVNGRGPLIEIPRFHHATISKYFNTTISRSNHKRPFPDIFVILEHSRSSAGNLSLHAVISLAHGKSRGTVRLRSTDPLASPIIDPKYYSEQDDVHVHIDGLRLLEKYESASAMAAVGGRYIPPEVCEDLYTPQIPRSEEFYKCLVKHKVRTLSHGCGTARIGRRQDREAVVDSKLRVYGINRLRVADASVMPHVTTSNTQSPCYMIGDKAAEMIMEDWGLKPNLRSYQELKP